MGLRDRRCMRPRRRRGRRHRPDPPHHTRGRPSRAGTRPGPRHRQRRAIGLRLRPLLHCGLRPPDTSRGRGQHHPRLGRPPRPAPAPQLRRDQGARRPRTVSRGIPDPHFPQITAELEPGNVLLLHTDGLTERNPHLRDEAELQALLTSVDGHDAHEILEQIERQSLGPEPRLAGRRRRDPSVCVHRAAGIPDASPAGTTTSIARERTHAADRCDVERHRRLAAFTAGVTQIWMLPQARATGVHRRSGADEPV